MIVTIAPNPHAVTIAHPQPWILRCEDRTIHSGELQACIWACRDHGFTIVPSVLPRA